MTTPGLVWMRDHRLPGGGITEEFKAAVDSFLDFVFANNDHTQCPCRRCQFHFFHERDKVLAHLYEHGFYAGEDEIGPNMHAYVGGSSAHPHRMSINTPADAEPSSQASVNAPPQTTTVDPDHDMHLRLANIQRLMEEMAARQHDATLRQGVVTGTAFSAEDIKRLVDDAMVREMASFRADIEHKMNKRLDTIEQQRRADMVKIEEQRMKDKVERHKIEEDRVEGYIQQLRSMEDRIFEKLRRFGPHTSG